MKTYLRFLSRNKGYTAVNVVGLSVSLAFVIMIGLYVWYEWTTDRWHRNADRIYMLAMDRNDGNGIHTANHWSIEQVLRDNFPEIERTCATGISNSNMMLDDTRKKEVHVLYTEDDFFQMFDFQILLGDTARLFPQANTVLLSESMARLLFGKEYPIGQTVRVMDGGLDLTVSGVFRDFERTSFNIVDMVMPLDVPGTMIMNPCFGKEDVGAYAQSIFIMTKPHADLNSKIDDMQRLLENKTVYRGLGRGEHIELIPLKDYYMMSNVWGPSTHNGDARLVRILLITGFVLLLFAMMNYVSLTIAQSTFRMREMAMRRLLGEHKKKVTWRILSESVLLSLFCMVVALWIAYALLPIASRLLYQSYYAPITLHLSQLFASPVMVLLLVLFVVVVGVVTGLFPSLYIAKVQPIEVVRGTITRRTKMLFSKLFITVQNVISITLIAVSLTMWLQMRHIVNAPLGYDKENVVQIFIDDLDLTSFLGEVRQLPGVVCASACDAPPVTQGFMQSVKGPDGNYFPQTFNGYMGDTVFMRVLDIKPLKEYGEVGSYPKYYVTPSVLEAQGLAPDATEFYFPPQFGDWNSTDRLMPVSGIIKGFKAGHIMTEESFPIIVAITDKNIDGGWATCVIAKLNGMGMVKTVQQIGELYEKHFHKEMGENCMFMDEYVRLNFQSHINAQRIVTVFTIVALLISLLGLVAMSTYYIQQRRREIAVRKVFGSKSRQVLIRLVRSFMLYVGIAAIIAIPIIYYIGNDWLSQFSYRISLSWWIYALAIFITALASFLAVFLQSWHAANANPVESIKQE